MPQEIDINESVIKIELNVLIENEYVKFEEDTLVFKNLTFENKKIKIHDDSLFFNSQKIENFKYTHTHASIMNLNIKFENCTIKQDVTIQGFLRHDLIFQECSISTVIFDKIKEPHLEAIIGNIKFHNCKKIETLQIQNCIFRGKFYINPQYSQDTENTEPLIITNIGIKDSIFENNFKLHNCEVKNFIIYDTDFMKKADFFKSKLDIQGKDLLEFKGINFYDLALFGDTKFEKFVQFKYVTFQGYSHFRKAKFKDGLDLEYANIEKEMNFFGISINSKSTQTTQETYRIIKYQLNKVGSIIDANKYYARELHEKWRSLKLWSKDFFDWWVFLFHLGSSNHSRWWFLPVLWIFVVGTGTAYLINRDIYDNLKMIFTWCFLEDTFRYMSITSTEYIKDHPIIFFFNKVSLGYLYYQFLTAIRKDTRQ